MLKVDQTNQRIFQIHSRECHDLMLDHHFGYYEQLFRYCHEVKCFRSQLKADATKKDEEKKMNEHPKIE